MTAPCLPCCSAPAECACALLIPPLNETSPYSDYATAAAVIADPLRVVDCLAFFQNTLPPTIATAVAGSNSLTLDETFSTASPTQMWASVNLLSGDTLSVAFSGTSSGGTPGDETTVALVVYDCNGNYLYDDFSTAASGTFTYPIPADGAYTITILFNGCALVFGCGWTVAHAVISGTLLNANPVIALWDDSGTTRQLEACPKMLLPPLTESTGDWYADCAAADAVLTDAYKVSNCVGYNETPFVPTPTFTATDGGTSLTLAVSTSGLGFLSIGPMWGSVNCVAGATLTATWAATGIATVVIYDYAGNVVETIVGAISPFVSAALPYTGRYIVKYSVFLGVPTASDSVVFTSSGTLSVNPVQALYDTGLSCPARLNCGDSC